MCYLITETRQLVAGGTSADRSCRIRTFPAYAGALNGACVTAGDVRYGPSKVSGVKTYISECETECTKEETCRGFEFRTDNRCYLFATIPNTANNGLAYSGIKCVKQST